MLREVKKMFRRATAWKMDTSTSQLLLLCHRELGGRGWKESKSQKARKWVQTLMWKGEKFTGFTPRQKSRDN